MVQEPVEPDTSLVTAKTPVQTWPTASLFFTHGVNAGQEIPLDRETFFIGRSTNNNLILADKSVSRRHALIHVVSKRYVLRDLGSMKGTYRNNKRIREVPLRTGDIIQIGENQMQFRMLAPSATPKKGAGSLIMIVLILALLVAMGWFFIGIFTKEKVPEEVQKRIEMHYSQGIEYFNKDHNVEKARAEWQKVLALDPEMKTDLAVKSLKLLKNIESGKTGE